MSLLGGLVTIILVNIRFFFCHQCPGFYLSGPRHLDFDLFSPFFFPCGSFFLYGYPGERGIEIWIAIVHDVDYFLLDRDSDSDYVFSNALGIDENFGETSIEISTAAASPLDDEHLAGIEIVIVFC